MIEIALVGPGVLGRTLALSLPTDTYRLGPVLSHSLVSSRRAVREMKRGVAAQSWADLAGSKAILVSVPQDRLAATLQSAADELPGLAGTRFLVTGVASGPAVAAIDRLEAAGARVAGLLPIALYRRPSFVAPNTRFALWGSPAALHTARGLVNALGGKRAVIDPEAGAETMLAIAIVSGVLTVSLELGIRRLVEAGFSRKQALDALAPLTDVCIQEHRHSRNHPPARRFPTTCAELLEAATRGDAMETALCRTALRLACEEFA
jgi:hypothetical protein